MNWEGVKLDIGGGTHKCGEDFISVDIQGADVIARMWELPFGDGTVDFIWSSHTLEHSGIHLVAKTLKEWFRVLKPGGAAIIRVPDFDYIAEYWLHGEDRVWAEMIVFGHQAHEGEYHKCAFTAESLRRNLETAGFTVAKVGTCWSHTQRTLEAVCTKS